ncbi:MAG: hypothetical protein IJF19_01740 [Clostridia bacterium]|nr:hypothetical protein [Clostridia bacterium]
MNRKVSLGITIAACLVAAAIAFSAAFMISRSIFNSKLKDLSQKQDMFTKLSDIDSFVRQHYNGNIDEKRLHDAMMKAYSEALDNEVLFMTAEEYKESAYEEAGCSFQILSDGTYMVMAEGVTVPQTEAATE